MSKAMPHPTTFWQYMAKSEQNRATYLRAHETGMLAFAEDILEIADNKSGDVDRDKLRVDTRKFLMSKLASRVFGDRINVEGNEGKPIVIRWQGEAEPVTTLDISPNANVQEHQANQASARALPGPRSKASK